MPDHCKISKELGDTIDTSDNIVINGAPLFRFVKSTKPSLKLYKIASRPLLVDILNAEPPVLVALNPLNCKSTPTFCLNTPCTSVPDPTFEAVFTSPGFDANVLIILIDFDVKSYCNCIPAPAIKLTVSLGDVEVTNALLPLCSDGVAVVEFTFILPKPLAPCTVMFPPVPRPPTISHCDVSNTPCVVRLLALHQANS